MSSKSSLMHITSFHPNLVITKIQIQLRENFSPIDLINNSSMTGPGQFSPIGLIITEKLNKSHFRGPICVFHLNKEKCMMMMLDQWKDFEAVTKRKATNKSMMIFNTTYGEYEFRVEESLIHRSRDLGSQFWEESGGSYTVLYSFSVSILF